MDQKLPKNWQPVRVGLIVGFVIFLIFFITYSSLGIVAVLLSIAWTWIGFVFGIAGASIGKSLNESRTSITIGAVVGAIIGVGGWVYLARLLGIECLLSLGLC